MEAVAPSPSAELHGSVDEAEAALILRGADVLARELWADAQAHALAEAPVVEPAPAPRRRRRSRLRRAVFVSAFTPLLLAAVIGVGTLRLSGGAHAFVN